MTTVTAGASIAERLDRLPLTRFHWILITAIFVGLAFDHMDQVVLSFVIPDYRREWGLSAGLASINPATGLAATFVGAVFWGIIADRIGRKPTLLLTLLIFAVTSGINGFSWGFGQLVLTCIAMGTGVGGAIPMAFTLLAEYTPARYRGTMMVMVGILSIVGGYLIASAGALFLQESVGWRSLFFIGLTPILLLPFIARYVPESPRFLVSKGRTREALQIVERLEAQARWGTPSPPPFAASRSAVRPSGDDPPAGGEGSLGFSGLLRLWTSSYRRQTGMLWLYAFAFGFFTFGFLTWFPTVLKGTGLNGGQVHLYTTIMDLMAVPSAALTAVLFFRWSTKKTLILYPAVAGAAMVLLSVLIFTRELNTAWLLFVGGVIFFFGTILLGVFGPYSAEVYPTEVRGQGAGWATGFSRFGAWTAIPLGGAILGGSVPLYAHQLIFGIPLFISALVMLAWGIETKGRRLESIALARDSSVYVFPKGQTPPAGSLHY